MLHTRRQLQALRAAWGHRRIRQHKFSAIAASCRSRFAVNNEAPAIDDRTWADLDLDDVFAEIDRTESTLGRHALSYRLRTDPPADDLRVFEALVTRMSADVAARERAQLAMSHLQDAHGYDVWWLGRPGAVAQPRWYIVFPFLTIATATLAILTISLNTLLPWLIGLILGILVTGSNMSGKSTFIRCVGVNVVLAQTLNTCLATSYQAPRLIVQSCIGREDDLMAGKSYYIVEVEQVLSRVRASAHATEHLFLFDELFRGTNAVERIAAAEAVLHELVEGKTHLVIVATHDAELTDLLADRYAPCHFTDTIGPNGLTFDYRLEAGPATTRNAIALLELSGAPAELVSRALHRAADLDRKRQSARSV